MANSGREPSRRAAARARYREAVAHDARSPYRPPTKLAQSDDPTLTARVRALYEGNVVPVREIAALAGVTERTLYKYARSHGWTPRVRRSGEGGAQISNAPAERAARGAGGRFIPLAEADQRHAHGLKALDPDGARRAAAHCTRAAELADAASAAAQSDAAADAQARTFEILAGSLVELHKICAPRPVLRSDASRADGVRGKAGWRPGKRHGEWLLPHEREADERRAQAQSQRVSGKHCGGVTAGPRTLRLQDAILRLMQRSGPMACAAPPAGAHQQP
jgi:hypothetical protein